MVRVDDSIDPFAMMGPDALAPDVGIYEENVSLGPGRSARAHWARFPVRQGQSKQEAVPRFREKLAGVQWPADAASDARFAFEETDEGAALRTFVLTGPSILTRRDVVAASVHTSNDMVYVAIELAPGAATAFEDATQQWLMRRIAIMNDGRVMSAPIVKSKIGGGRLSITLGIGVDDVKKKEAQRLADELVPPTSP